jgi:response regulator RpfG family c-di-GMP phosphodiesterase
MAIADFYDALISKRVYNPPMSHTKAVGDHRHQARQAFRYGYGQRLRGDPR